MARNMLKTKAKDPTCAVFGVTPEGRPYVQSIAEGVHWLIAGTTGSGKSVYVNQILVSMMYHAHPDELKITWIDPKKVEAANYAGLPYCPVDPITDMGDAYGFVAYLVWEMERRYVALQKKGFQKLDELNAWIDASPMEAASQGYARKLPYMVCVIDEYADLAQQCRDVEALIQRLAQKARAAGIHLIIATQRPSMDVISSTLKANLPSRIALKVASAVNSAIILDHEGAEKLMGYGDSLVVPNGGDETRVQGAYLPNDTIKQVFAFLRERYARPDPIEWKEVVTSRERCREAEVSDPFCSWAEEYAADVPMDSRHVTPARKGRGRY